MRIFIPANCETCQFFNETEDGDLWCCLYQKGWDSESEDEIPFDSGIDKPEFCHATEIVVTEVVH